MASPAVSVCVPVYNGERYLFDCLQSIRDQSLSDIDVLIVDDCSTDRSLEIAQSFAAADARFTVHANQRNLGLVGNWNECVERSKGDWIKFVFQDDTIAPSCIELMLQRVRPATLLAACSRDFIFDPDTPESLQDWYRGHQRATEHRWGVSRSVGADDFCAATLDEVGGNLVGEPTSVLINRAAFERHGLFNANLIMSCDLEYWNRIGVNAGFEWISDRLASFRVHGGATSAENRSSRSYRMGVLDNLILLHEFAFALDYAALRHAARQRTPPVDLNDKFSSSAQWAWRTAISSDPQNEAAQRMRLQEWENVARSYPRIREAARISPRPWGSRLVQLITGRADKK